MVHGILQFTPSIAFRYVLHRCKSRDIRCRESFCTLVVARRPDRTPSPETAGENNNVWIPWRVPRRGFVVWAGGRPAARPAFPGTGFV